MRLCLKALNSLACVVVGVCLIASCVDIYMSGDKPFSPQAVAQRFHVIDVPVYICLAVIATCTVWLLVLSLLYPSSQKRKNTERYTDAYIKSLTAKADLTSCDLGLAYVVNTQRKKRFILSAVFYTLLSLGAAVFSVFAFNPDNYQRDDVNTSVIKLSIACFLCIVPVAAIAVVREYILRGIRKTEGEALKKIIAAGSIKTVSSTSFWQRWQNVIRLACIVIAVALIVIGFLMGGSDAVLTKAVNLCMECVGLG